MLLKTLKISTLALALSSCVDIEEITYVPDPSGFYNISIEEDIYIRAEYGILSSVDYTDAYMPAASYFELLGVNQEELVTIWDITYDAEKSEISIGFVDPEVGDVVGDREVISVDQETGMARISDFYDFPISEGCHGEIDVDLDFFFLTRTVEQHKLEAGDVSSNGNLESLRGTQTERFITLDSSSSTSYRNVFKDFKEQIAEGSVSSSISRDVFHALIFGALDIANLEHLRSLQQEVTYTVYPGFRQNQKRMSSSDDSSDTKTIQYALESQGLSHFRIVKRPLSSVLFQ